MWVAANSDAEGNHVIAACGDADRQLGMNIARNTNGVSESATNAVLLVELGKFAKNLRIAYEPIGDIKTKDKQEAFDAIFSPDHEKRRYEAVGGASARSIKHTFVGTLQKSNYGGSNEKVEANLTLVVNRSAHTVGVTLSELDGSTVAKSVRSTGGCDYSANTLSFFINSNKPL